MNGRTILVGLLGLVGLVILTILLVAILSPDQQSSNPSDSYFSNLQFGSAGHYAYSIFRYSGKGNVTVFTYPAKPLKHVYLINDNQAVEATKFADFEASAESYLEPYGMEISVSNASVSNDGIYIVPTGAMPSYVISALSRNRSNFYVIYFGQKDLVIQNGLKRSNWYDLLTEGQKKKIVYVNSSLDDFVDLGNYSIFESILENDWIANAYSSVHLSGISSKTLSVPINNSSFIRVIYDFGNTKGIIDSESFYSPSKDDLLPNPSSIFPWEKSNLEFVINRTNGTAMLSVSHDGKEISSEELQRVTEQNVFIRKLQFNESGDYVISIRDNSGQVASGILHIKDLSIQYKQSRGVSYFFDVYLDGRRLSDAKASVSIGNSSSAKDFYVSNGTLVINAALPKGENIINIDLYGSKTKVIVVNNNDSFFDFYFKYGIPGLLLVAIVFVGARLSRRPTYSLRFGEGVPYVREEVRSNISSVLSAFKRSRSDFNLGKSPINQQEFAVSLRRYVTNGADVTEGNIESIVKKLIKDGKIEGYKDYYQLPNEGSIKYNYLKRRIRDLLIEHGLEFDEKGNKFVCTDFEIGFFGEKFSKKAIVIFDDQIEINQTLSNMEAFERSKVEVKVANGLLRLVAIDQLGEIL